VTIVSSWGWHQLALLWMASVIVLVVLVMSHLYFAPSFAVPIPKRSEKSRLSILWLLARALWRISPAAVVESIVIPLTATAITVYWIVERVTR
jgi:hypothetical protein